MAAIPCSLIPPREKQTHEYRPTLFDSPIPYLMPCRMSTNTNNTLCFFRPTWSLLQLTKNAGKIERGPRWVSFKSTLQALNFAGQAHHEFSRTVYSSKVIKIQTNIYHNCVFPRTKITLLVVRGHYPRGFQFRIREIGTIPFPAINCS